MNATKIDMSPEKIVQMLLNDSEACIVDSSVTYLTENEDGYEDHNLPILSAYHSCDDDEPFFEVSLDELATATVTTFPVSVTIKTDSYGVTTIRPLVQKQNV